MEDILNKYLVDIATISRLQSGDRLNTTREFLTIDEPQILQCILRKYEGDTRDRTIAAVCRIITTVITFAELLIESRFLAHPDFYVEGAPVHEQHSDAEEVQARLMILVKIRNSIVGAKIGLRNLCVTYHDPNVSGYINPLDERIDCCVCLINTVMTAHGERVRW